MIGRAARWFDDRLRAAAFVRDKLNKVFPEHFSFLFGELAFYSFIVLVATGIFLAMFFNPSLGDVVYDGAYEPLRGVKMSEAYKSVLELSFDVQSGLVMRQIHHWAALVFMVAIVLHLCRIFFTGAFRRPREINWMIGVTLLALGMFNGFSGYSLPDDLLSGTGLRIAHAIVQSIPVIGNWAVFLIFGGEYPSQDILTRLLVMHIMIVPGALVALIAVHLALIVRQKHTHFPGPGRREDNVVGVRLWPTYTAYSLGLFFILSAVLAGLGGLVQINPIWLWGPYEPYLVTIAAQPDWYVGWVEGALRLFPPWEIRAYGYMIPNAFFPGALLPAMTFLAMYAWPFLEARFTGDYDEHHVLDRPRDRPMRTALGVVVLTFYGVLLIAGANDVIATELSLPIVTFVYFLRVVVLALPVLAGIVAWKFFRDLRGRSRQEIEAEETSEAMEAAEAAEAEEAEEPAGAGEPAQAGRSGSNPGGGSTSNPGDTSGGPSTTGS